MTNLADLHTGFAAEAAAGPFYPGEITLTLKRGSVEILREMLGKEPISRTWAVSLHAILRDELNKTCDDLQHEKLEAATRAAQERALHGDGITLRNAGDTCTLKHTFTTGVIDHQAPADIHVRGQATDIALGAVPKPLTDEQIEKMRMFGLGRDWLIGDVNESTIAIPSDPVDGNDPDDIARAVYEFLNERFLTPPKTARERFELCRQVVAFVRHHLPEEKPQTNSYTVTLEMPRYKVSWLKRLLENRMRRESISEMLIKDFKLALGEEVDDDGR